MFELSVKGNIAAAHFLRKYEGPCKNLHGHTWHIEVFICGDRLDEIGMVCDFSILKKKLKSFLHALDHVCLNELDIFKEINPTTENLAQYIFQEFKKEIEPLKLEKVRVSESETSSVTYFEKE